MALLFSLLPVRIPTKPGEPQKFYARSQTRSIISTNRLVEDITWGTTLTKGDVYHVVLSLVHAIKKHMLDGNCVDLIDFGKFRYHIHSSGASSRKDFNYTYIQGVKIHFTPDEAFMPAPHELSFQQTIPVRLNREIKRRNNHL